jgi:aspartate racemase
MKTIGILGGVGPQATMNFEEHLHLASHQLIPPLFNSGYPPMIVFYHRHAPVMINKDLTPVFPITPDPGLLEAAKKLGLMTDFLVIPSNGVHMMQAEIE